VASGKIIETVLTTDVDGVVRGAEKVADSFSDIQDSLKDTGKAGEKSFEQIEDAAKDLAESGEKSFEKLEDSATEASKVIDRDLTQALKEVEEKADSAGKSGKNIADGFKDGTSKAKGSLSELKEEANSTAKEAGASFDGSAAGIADAFQEVAANTFGPLGLAAAVGIGIAISKMQELAEVNNEAKEKAADLAREIYETGGKIDDADIAEKIKDIAFALSEEDNPWTPWANEAKSAIDEVRKASEGLSNDVAKDIFKGLAGDVGAGQRAYDALTKSIDANRQEAGKHRTVLEDGRIVFDDVGKSLIATADAQEKQQKKLEEATGASKDASSQAEYYTQVMGESSDAVDKRKDAEDKLLDTQRERVEAQEALDEATKNSIVTELDYLDSVDALSAKLSENGNTMDTNTAKGRENQRAVIELTDDIEAQAKAALESGESTATVTARFNEQKELLINQLTPAFGGSRDAAQRYVDTVLKVPGRVSTDILLNDQDARRKLDDLTKARTAPLYINPQGDAVEKWFMSQQGRKVFVDFAPRGGGQAISPP
jgi:hypothetical protein